MGGDMDADIVAQKTALRTQALTGRLAGGDAAALAANLRRALAPHAGRVLAGYWPMRGEADPRPGMEAHDGPLCLPVVPGRGQPLVFRLWRGEALVPGSFGTSHPPDSAPEVTPEVLIVPLVGFDAGLNRLGYGGGFYDRTLARLRDAGPVTSIGLGWAGQQLPAIPATATDERLDAIVTDRGILATPA